MNITKKRFGKILNSKEYTRKKLYNKLKKAKANSVSKSKNRTFRKHRKTNLAKKTLKDIVGGAEGSQRDKLNKSALALIQAIQSGDKSVIENAKKTYDRNVRKVGNKRLSDDVKKNVDKALEDYTKYEKGGVSESPVMDEKKEDESPMETSVVTASIDEPAVDGKEEAQSEMPVVPDIPTINEQEGKSEGKEEMETSVVSASMTEPEGEGEGETKEDGEGADEGEDETPVVSASVAEPDSESKEENDIEGKDETSAITASMSESEDKPEDEGEGVTPIVQDISTITEPEDKPEGEDDSESKEGEDQDETSVVLDSINQPQSDPEIQPQSQPETDSKEKEDTSIIKPELKTKKSMKDKMKELFKTSNNDTSSVQTSREDRTIVIKITLPETAVVGSGETKGNTADDSLMDVTDLIGNQ